MVTTLVGRFRRPEAGEASILTAVVALGLAFGSLFLAGEGAVPFPLGETTLRADGLALLLALTATGLGLAVAVYSLAFTRGEAGRPTYAALLLLMVMGIAGLGLAGDLFTLFVFFELMAIASYGLVAFHREQAEAAEAGMKYVIMSGSGSLVALVGIGLAYLGRGTLDLAPSAAIPRELALPAGALLIAGFGVKAAVVPMHTWLPDAHTVAPTGISALLSGILIQAGLLALVRSLVIFGVGPTAVFSYGLLLAFLAILTMTVGNLLAMHQRDLKRLLACSSIAQMGYILLGFGVGLEFGVVLALAGGFFHILNHALLKGGAFLAVGVLQRAYGTRDLDALQGAGRRVPVAGFTFALFALGLAGVPPTAGFLSKLFLALGSVQAGGALGVLFVVALVANSALSLAYYVPALTRLLAREGPTGGPEGPPSPLLVIPLGVLAFLVLLLGLWAEPALVLVEAAVESLLTRGGPPG